MALLWKNDALEIDGQEILAYLDFEKKLVCPDSSLTKSAKIVEFLDTWPYRRVTHI